MKLAAFFEAWLDQAPESLFLCTSRIALRLGTERRYPLGALTPAEGAELLALRSERAFANCGWRMRRTR